MSICAIHQPNFLPWLPYFDKISKADTFVFLDEVDYPKSGNSMGSWCNRVKILMNKDDIWFSIPVIRQAGIQKIKTVEINYKEFNISKVLSTLKCAYGKLHNFAFICGLIEDAYHENNLLLADFNISLIKKIVALLGIKTELLRQSQFQNRGLSSNEMLADLCLQSKSSHYLSGLGAKEYMNHEIFNKQKIDIIYQSQIYSEQINVVKKYSILHFLMVTDKECWGKFNADY